VLPVPAWLEARRRRRPFARSKSEASSTKQLPLAPSKPRNTKVGSLPGASEASHKPLLIEEFHLTLLVPLYLASAVDKTICQTLEDVPFRADLRRGVRAWRATPL
jgi:hypothetical protein